MHVDGGEKVDGGAGFDEEKDFGRGDYVGEIGDGLLDAVVEDVEIVAVKAFDQVTVRVGHRDRNSHAVNGDTNRRAFGLPRFRGLRESERSGHPQNGIASQFANKWASKAHFPTR